MPPLVSVVVPCFNSRPCLSLCLESLKGQTFSDFEVIVIDDGSDDGTAEITRQWTEHDHRFRLYSREHAGVAKAMNFGIQMAEGEYVARMDSDDVCRPDRLEKQSDFLLANPAIGLVGSRVDFGGDRERAAGYAFYVDWINSVVNEHELRVQRFVELLIPNPSIMFRKSLIQKHGGFLDGYFPEDYEFILRLMDASVRVSKLPEKLLLWNDRPERLSRSDSRYSRDAFYRLKSLYLSRWLKGKLGAKPKVGVLGAGRTVRRKLQPLLEQEVRVCSCFDLSEKRISRVSNPPVKPLSDLPQPGRLFILSYVGSRGARRKIHEFMRFKGYRRERDYLFVS